MGKTWGDSRELLIERGFRNRLEEDLEEGCSSHFIGGGVGLLEFNCCLLVKLSSLIELPVNSVLREGLIKADPGEDIIFVF